MRRRKNLCGILSVGVIVELGECLYEIYFDNLESVNKISSMYLGVLCSLEKQRWSVSIREFYAHFYECNAFDHQMVFSELLSEVNRFIRRNEILWSRGEKLQRKVVHSGPFDPHPMISEERTRKWCWTSSCHRMGNERTRMNYFPLQFSPYTPAFTDVTPLTTLGI
jgi:hypothetical protein